MNSLFSFDDYRSYLKARVKAEKENWGLWARLAKAAGCQPTYLSQTIKGKAHLTADHIIGIARYLSLSDTETDFLLLLLELARAGTKELRQYLTDKIKRIRQERGDLATRLAKPKLDIGSRESLYYSAWHWSALHVIVSIPEYRTVDAISRRLQIPADFVEFALNRLAEEGIVRFDGRQWQLVEGDLHIPKNSPMISMHHNNWRQRAVTDSSMPGRESIHYTGVYSLSRSDVQHLKEKMLDLIEHSRKVIAPSKEEEMICFLCDLFYV